MSFEVYFKIHPWGIYLNPRDFQYKNPRAIEASVVKIRTKTRLNFTIDRSVASRFTKLCKEKGYNMSAKIEQAMKELIEKEETKK